jgi:hypothetical protein
MNSGDINRQGISEANLPKSQIPGGISSAPEQVGRQGQSAQSKLAQGIGGFRSNC